VTAKIVEERIFRDNRKTAKRSFDGVPEKTVELMTWWVPL
jgi:hypothetical protein